MKSVGADGWESLAFSALIAAALTLAVAALVKKTFPTTWRTARARYVLVFALFTLVLWFGSIALPMQALAGVSAAAFVIAAPIVARRGKRARAIEAALAGLSDDARRAASVAVLDAFVANVPRDVDGRAYARWTRVTHHIAQRAALAGCPAEALRWAERVDPAHVDAVTRVARAQLIASCAIALRDRARARKELAAVARPVRVAMWERAMQSMEALLEALEGDAARAEERARAGLAAETNAIVKSVWQSAHAHALAALDQRDEALAALRALRDATPDRPILRRIVAHGGPASPLAESLLVEKPAAYR